MGTVLSGSTTNLVLVGQLGGTILLSYPAL
jgi:hypothetical protein